MGSCDHSEPITGQDDGQWASLSHMLPAVVSLGSKAGPVVVFGTEFSIGERLLSSEEDTRMADIRDNEA